MNYKRREFIKLGSSMAASLALAPLAGGFLNNSQNATLDKFGIQLWTVKNALGKDPQGCIEAIVRRWV
jgi:hypothetical protein